LVLLFFTVYVFIVFAVVFSQFQIELLMFTAQYMNIKTKSSLIGCSCWRY